MKLRMFVAALLSACGSAGSAPASEPYAWQPPEHSALCVHAVSTTGLVQDGSPTDCRSIDVGSEAFTAADNMLSPSGPHRYEIDPITTATVREQIGDACCYQVEYPPPPGG